MRFRDIVARPDVEETVVLRGPIGLLAPHGRSIEDGTERIATEVAERTGSSLYCVTYPGTWDEARLLHVSCTRIQPDETDALASFTRHCTMAVAVHGFTRADMRHTALVGGANEDAASRLVSSLRRRLPEPADVREGDDVPLELRGRSPRNLVNRFPEPGCQVELPPRLRTPYPSRVLWGGWKPNPNIYADAVIDALCEVVASYTSFTS